MYGDVAAAPAAGPKPDLGKLNNLLWDPMTSPSPALNDKPQELAQIQGPSIRLSFLPVKPALTSRTHDTEEQGWVTSTGLLSKW
jgi:hypothetical protein